MNDKTARGRLEMIIAANFNYNDHVITLTYAESKNPQTRGEAEFNIKKFLSKYRKVRKNRGESLDYIYVTENKHGKGRYHHHIILNRAGKNDYEEIRSLWEYGDNTEIQKVADRTFFQLAEYITKEGGNRKVGGRLWICSLGLRKPEVTREYVQNNTQLTIPEGCEVIEREEKQNEFGTFSYIKYFDKGLNRRGEPEKAERKGFHI